MLLTANQRNLSLKQNVGYIFKKIHRLNKQEQEGNLLESSTVDAQRAVQFKLSVSTLYEVSHNS